MKLIYKYKIAFLIFISFLLIACQSHKRNEDNGNHFFFERLNNNSKNGDIIFISDTQEPIWVETLLMNRNNNLLARDIILKEILEKKPSKVIHLGDIVAFGFKDSEWQPIDTFLHALIDGGSEFYPTLGNHELLLFSDTGENNFMKRFPFYSRTGYVVNNGPVKIILLNSNFGNMSKEEIVRQQEWYLITLKHLEQDSTVSTVIVGCHHPPFTNSKIINPSKQVEELFVPAFIQTGKCKLFISGHCHAFEHFKYKDKDFLVIGGGGGLQQPLYVGDEKIYKDIYDSISKKRMFHFLECRSKNDTMRITLNMLKKDFSGFNRDYKINIPLK